MEKQFKSGAKEIITMLHLTVILTSIDGPAVILSTQCFLLIAMFK